MLGKLKCSGVGVALDEMDVKSAENLKEVCDSSNKKLLHNCLHDDEASASLSSFVAALHSRGIVLPRTRKRCGR